MDKAKVAVSDFMAKAGHHDTTVHEKVAPAVVNEEVKKVRHEEAQTAIDREVHQDHFHTSVQPVKDREVLPEQHSHNTVPVEHREHHHGNSDAIKARLEQERLQFQNTRSEAGTKESHSVAPVIAGEHVHHHVHETIQPVINKETIQPSVVHTTVPIHEVHHNEAKHHAASALPAVSMADFKKQGGSLTGREERYDGFEGEPRAVGSSLGGSALGSSTGHTGHTGHHDSHNAGPHNSSMGNKMDPRVDSDLDGKRGIETGSGHNQYGSNTGSGTTGGYGSGPNAGPHNSGMGNKMDPRVDSDLDGKRGIETGSGHNQYGSNTGSGTTGEYGHNTAGTKKPGMMDKLNPMKDSDHDGKKGFME